MFDGRKDLTKTIIYSEDGKPYQKEILEDYYCIYSEPGEKYLFHFVNNPEERGDSTPAEHIAQQLFEWITKHKLENQLVAIGGDSTNRNTGCIIYSFKLLYFYFVYIVKFTKNTNLHLVGRVELFNI